MTYCLVLTSAEWEVAPQHEGWCMKASGLGRRHQCWLHCQPTAFPAWPSLFCQKPELLKETGKPCPALRLHGISTELYKAALLEVTGEINLREATQDAGDTWQFSYLGKLVGSPASWRLTSKARSHHLFSPDCLDSAVLIRDIPAQLLCKRR